MRSQTRVFILRQHAAVYIVDRPLLITEDVSTALQTAILTINRHFTEFTASPVPVQGCRHTEHTDAWAVLTHRRWSTIHVTSYSPERHRAIDLIYGSGQHQQRPPPRPSRFEGCATTRRQSTQRQLSGIQQSLPSGGRASQTYTGCS